MRILLPIALLLAAAGAGWLIVGESEPQQLKSDPVEARESRAQEPDRDLTTPPQVAIPDDNGTAAQGDVTATSPRTNAGRPAHPAQPTPLSPEAKQRAVARRKAATDLLGRLGHLRDPLLRRRLRQFLAQSADPDIQAARHPGAVDPDNTAMGLEPARAAPPPPEPERQRPVTPRPQRPAAPPERTPRRPAPAAPTNASPATQAAPAPAELELIRSHLDAPSAKVRNEAKALLKLLKQPGAWR